MGGVCPLSLVLGASPGGGVGMGPQGAAGGCSQGLSAALGELLCAGSAALSAPGPELQRL